jgi:Tfp pilus assembly protein PilO
MAKPAPKKDLNPILRINLLHPQGQQLKFSGKFLSWLLGYGRFIIIVVEIAVIICLLYRFKLDADLDSINNQIRQEAASIQSHSADEKLIKQTQEKLKVIGQTYKNTPDWRNGFASLSKTVPTGVTFNNLSLQHDQNARSVQFKVSATAKSSQDLASFLNALKETDKDDSQKVFKDINLSNVSLSEGSINFLVSGTIK